MGGEYFPTSLMLLVACGFAYQSASQKLLPLPPQVAISFPDVGDRDFVNETLAIMSNSNAAFVMECNATYPIEWVFHYNEEDDGASEKLKLAETRRYAEEFLDPNSYRYTAQLRIEYNGKLLVLSNFTCKATQSNNPNYQTHVYMTDRNKKSVLLLEISNEYRAQYLLPPQNADNNENCKLATTTVAYLLDWRSPCWTCKVPQGEELELDFQTCQTPIQCNSMQARQKKGKQCVQEVEEISNTCKLDQKIEFFPKMILCKNFGPALAQLYFFGVFRGDFEDEVTDGPPIYFDWADADPAEMLHIHPIKSVVYEDEEIIIKCDTPDFTFRWVPAFDIKPCETSADFVNTNTRHDCNKTDEARRMGTYTATLKRTFKILGPHQVFCFGPVWNSTEWVDANATFVVEKGTHPRVLSVASEKNEPFILGQRNRSLICNFEGLPTPQIQWKGPEESVYAITTEGNRSRLKFSEIGYQSSGEYICLANSFLGNHSQSFYVKSQPPSVGLSTAGIVGITLTCLVIVVVFVAVTIRMRSIIVRQQKALRILTEAEIQEFINGNPEIAKKAQNNYFNNVTSIEALPYDKKYEIPVEKLSVDYSHILGSGEYGIVLKGKVHPENASHYVNVASLPDAHNETDKEVNGFSQDKELEVAVKICKKDVDVTSFKALLSEVKVMAYLGQHENIVSLIGASTKNIQNRELFIAVEYCHNGSLESYMKTNKTKFLNKVKYGFYNGEDGRDVPSSLNVASASDADSYVNLENTAGTFSSMDLFRWTHGIAEGVEYIHSKRVIHGDLALRNVLITQGLTAKVGDFGLSRQLGDSANYTKKTQCALPWRNMALESLKELDFSVKSDMWALGVTLWELYTLGNIPYTGLTYTLEFIGELEAGSLRLPKPPNATNDIYEFMLMTWEKVPADRPSTTEIKTICQKLLKTKP